MNPDVIFVGNPETRNMQSGEIARAFFKLKTTDVVQDENLAARRGSPPNCWPTFRIG